MIGEETADKITRLLVEFCTGNLAHSR
jgi:hypothetical protein